MDGGKTLCFLDIETTGFDIVKHEIIEIAAVYVKFEDGDFQILKNSK